MKYLFWLFLIIVLIFRYLTSFPHFTNGQLLKITGPVFSEPVIFGKFIKFNLSGIKVNLPFADIHYGDFVVVEGEYKDGELVNAKLDQIKISENIFVKTRRKFINFYETSLPKPHSSLVGGITIGAKANLPQDFAKKLKNTGTSHVVVASGMNVTMVAGFLMAVTLSITKRKYAIILTILAIWVYTLVTGFEAPIIRASIMATTAFIGTAFGRVANTLRYTLIAVFLMLFAVPTWITDIGFLLSFATTISMILFASKINTLIHFVPPIIRENLSTSLAAQIGSSPIILFVFGRINLLSPLINASILWIVAPVMIIGGISGLISLIFPPIAKIMLLLVYPLTTWFITIINIFG